MSRDKEDVITTARNEQEAKLSLFLGYQYDAAGHDYSTSRLFKSHVVRS